MPTPLTVRNISIEIQRKRDGKKYPNPLKESYKLQADGTLRYFGYFGAMPTNVNHTDSITWPAGAHGKKVLDAVAAIVGDRKRFAALKEVPDEGPSPCGKSTAYAIGLSHEQADVDYCLPATARQVFALLDTVFVALIAEFERQKGRPLTPATLPSK